LSNRKNLLLMRVK